MARLIAWIVRTLREMVEDAQRSASDEGSINLEIEPQHAPALSNRTPRRSERDERPAIAPQYRSPRVSTRRRSVRSMLRDRHSLRDAVVLKEILDAPASMRRRRRVF